MPPRDASYRKGWDEGREELADAVVDAMREMESEFDDVEEFAEELTRVVEHELSSWEDDELEEIDD